jgi:membrane protease YdiL (CAAX protease family)
VLELALVFVGLPVAYRAGVIPLPMLATLDIVALVATGALLLDRTFEPRRLWRARALRDEAPAIAVRAAAAAAVIALTVLVVDPAAWLELPRRRVELWARLLVVYPVLSAWPQELLFRSWFFHRYAVLFGEGRALMLASAAAFSFLHIVFPNVVAITLTAPAGLVLAWTYRRTGSLVVVAVEHALWGVLVFTLGLGRYFI